MFAFSLRLVAPYWKWLAIVIATMVVEIVMTLASPWPLKIVLDSVFGAEPIPPVFAWFTGPVTDRLALLNIAVGATVVIALLQAAGAYLNAYYTVSIGQWIAHDLRQSVYAHLQRLSLSYYDRHQVGPLISTITDDIDAVQEFISTSLLDLVIDSLTIAGMLVVMLSLNWRFTLVALAVTPLMLIFVYRLRAAVKSATHDVRRRQSELVTIVQEGLGAIRVVKAFAQGRFERQRLEAKSVESVEAALKARRVRSLLGPVVTALVALGTAAVLWFGARLVLEGAMTAGALVVFLTYLGRLFRPIQAVARASTNIAQATVGLERVRDVLDADDRLVRAPNAAPLGPVEGRVEFRDVTFGYDPSRPVLRDISFTIEPGQLVGLVGPSGGGKSTLVGLLARFYDPQQGAVLIDGRDIREATIRSLRGQIGFVLQDTQLFHAPVWHNIAYGRPDATRDQILDAARLAQAHDFIEALPQGYDTVVGQGGLTLSGGQRQRLGIARAMVRDARILVLDEPTSGLDAASERLVFEALRRLRNGRTTFVIAHRLATVRRADVILVIADGRIVERGTHGALARAGGLYARLLDAQEQEEEERPSGPERL
ncbi:MAG: ABC transporter ATP-binding protein/permease [Vicinamibacteraceae bacterium]|nr:ABC transporter ATP-binding protein/permease [Vicinamibacteraceae bacterium]